MATKRAETARRRLLEKYRFGAVTRGNPPRYYSAKFKITTYYTPREESFTGARNTPITCVDKDGNTVTFSVRASWLGVVDVEGWGRVDVSDPNYGGQFVSYVYSAGKRYLRTQPLGALGENYPLVAGESLAVDPAIIPMKTYPVSFSLPRQTNGVGPTIAGRAVDKGGEIEGYHIDLYVGVRARPGSGYDDAYQPDTFADITVTW